MPLETYEAHMALSQVGQQQVLNAIIKHQINDYSAETIAILGVAGGNGLEHIAPSTKVYGIDVSEAYLEACARRFAHRGKSLVLIQADLSDEAACLPPARLVIANLFIEYVGIICFVRLIKTASPRYVSCVVQNSSADSFVSSSPYTQAFVKIAFIHHDIDAQCLETAMKDAGYVLIKKTKTILPNDKSFLRLDFCLEGEQP